MGRIVAPRSRSTPEASVARTRRPKRRPVEAVSPRRSSAVRRPQRRSRADLPRDSRGDAIRPSCPRLNSAMGMLKRAFPPRLPGRQPARRSRPYDSPRDRVASKGPTRDSSNSSETVERDRHPGRLAPRGQRAGCRPRTKETSALNPRRGGAAPVAIVEKICSSQKSNRVVGPRDRSEPTLVSILIRVECLPSWIPRLRQARRRAVSRTASPLH